MKKHYSLLIPALCLMLFAACEKKESAELRLRLPTDPPTIDWTLANDNISKEVIAPLQEGLVEEDSAARPQPALAESWTVSPDGKTYTFKLRDGIVWSDGVKVTTQQFVDSWQRCLDKKVASEYAYFLFDIVGAEDFNNGKLTDFNQVGVKAPDEKTLVVQLKTPVAYWIHIPTFWVTFPIRKDVIEKWGDKWTDPEHIVSTGPYILKEFVRDSKMVLEKNPKYFRKDVVEQAISRVVFRVVKDDSTAVTLFNNKDLDIVRDLPPIQIATLSKSSEFIAAPFLRGYYIGFNVKDQNVADVNIRRALAYATNRAEVEQVVTSALATATNAWIPPGVLAYNKDRGLGYDPVKAKEAWAKVKNKPTQLEIWYDQKELNRLVIENLQNQWKRTLGIDVKLNTQEWKVYLKSVKNNPPALWRMGWGADYPDPDTFMNLFTCSSGNNFTKFCEKRYDELITRAAAGRDEAERSKNYDEAQKLLLEDQVAIIPIFTQTNMHLVSSRVSGFKANPMGDYMVRDMRFVAPAGQTPTVAR